MAFIGSITKDMQAAVAKIVRRWPSTKLQVLCSGNFTVETLCETACPGRFELWGNDVSLYTSMLGGICSGAPIRVGIKDEARERWGWLEPWLDTPERAFVSVSVLLDAGPAILKPEHAYYGRLLRAFQRQWETVHERTLRKCERAFTLPLRGFHCADALEVAETLGPEVAVVSFPPIWPKGYANLYKGVDSIFQWDAPEYPELDAERIDRLLARIRDRERWVLATAEAVPALGEHLVGSFRTSLRTHGFWMYSSDAVLAVVQPQVKCKVPTIAHLGPSDDLEGEVALVPLTPEAFNGLRSEYLNPAIVPASTKSQFGVTVGGKLVGCFATSSTQGPIKTVGSAALPEPYLYLMSDFPIRPTKYRNLAKLVLFSALSKEAKALAERIENRRMRGLLTTAFSMRPVSMKYRGLFEIITRKELPAAHQFRYQLNYGAPLGQWSLAEGLALWRKQYGETR